MSEGNLLYLTDKPSSGLVAHSPNMRVEELVAKVSSGQPTVPWFVDSRNVFRKLIANLADTNADIILPLKKDGILLLEVKARSDQRDRTPEALFHSVLEIDRKTSLGFDEILEITKEEHPEDFAIAAHVNLESKTITFYRGDFSSILVPLGRFKRNARSEPDFSKLKIVDHGMAIRLGAFEASIYPILYESDPVYRRRFNKQRKAEEKTFGACLFRARKIFDLNQSDFPGVRRETILRIENQKSTRVRASTRDRILKVLKMTELQLLGY